LKVVVDEERLRPEKSEVMRLQSDNNRARVLLGWEPKVNFRQGLQETISWVKEHIDLYRVGIYEK